jgi:hypothetical protein
MLNIPDDSKTFAVKKDTMTPGISFHNSEIGLAVIGISAYILRLVCTNGMVVPVKLGMNKYRHVSQRVLKEFPEIISSLCDGLVDHKKKIKLSRASHVDDPLSTIESFNRRFS